MAARRSSPSELWRRLPAPWRCRAPNLSKCKPELKTVPTRCRWPPGSSPSPRSAQKTGAEPPKVLLRRPLRRVKFAQRRLRVFPMGAGGMPPASGRAPPAKRRRGARGNRLSRFVAPGGNRLSRFVAPGVGIRVPAAALHLNRPSPPRVCSRMLFLARVLSVTSLA